MGNRRVAKSAKGDKKTGKSLYTGLPVTMQGPRDVVPEISTQLGKTALMPAAGKFGFDPLPDYIEGYFRADYPTAETEYIGIVVLPAHPGGVGFMAERGPDVPMPVGGYGHADSCPADQDAPFTRPVQDKLAHGIRKIGIIDGFFGMTARIPHFMPLLLQIPTISLFSSKPP
jgi:hypothetical protein